MQQPPDGVWFVASLIVGIGILGLVLADVWRPRERGVIAREERSLDRAFGPDYGRYKATVRRWL